MTDLHLQDLPEPIVAFLEAANSGDLEAIVSSFVPDALVNDQLSDHWGGDAIREWASQEIISVNLQIEVTRSQEHYGDYILTSVIDGTFDKRGLPDPLLMNFYLSLRKEKIVQLIILHNTINA